MYSFCPFCQSVLFIGKANGKASFSCSACSYSKYVNYLKKRITFDNKIEEKIIWQEDVLRSMPKCKKNCDKCGHETAAFYEMQTRSADEPMTTFYRCLRCKNTWKE